MSPIKILNASILFGGFSTSFITLIVSRCTNESITSLYLHLSR